MSRSGPPPHAERLTFFSDAVAAIALTLLVLPLVELVPEAVRKHESPADVVSGNLTSFGSFVLSFFVIWRIWSVHHRLFDKAKVIDRRIIRINSLWLLCVVVLSFAAEMVGAYGDDHLVISLYIGVLVASAITLTLLAAALRQASEVGAGPDRRVLEELIGNAVCLVLAFLVALAVPGAGYWPLLLLLADTPVRALVRRRH